MQRLLEGEVIEGRDESPESEIARLERTIDDLTRKWDKLRNENVELKRQCAQAASCVSRLRSQLEPLYRALQGVWGELDSVDTDPPTDARAAPSNRVWESWKSKLGGKQAEFINILLEHGEMTAAQLKAAAHVSSDTVYQTVYKLNKAGLVSKNGGRFSLKSI